MDINEILHEERSFLLRNSPKTDGVFLSAGCSGEWYFKWIEDVYGTVTKHIGLEYYSPKPERLPANVDWIENTVSDMREVDDASVDVLFSGQNIEHLWPDDVLGFLKEAARVVKPGGAIIVDSPNRAVTEKLSLAHPEHTVELTVGEAEELLERAGFSITKKSGIWLCRDSASGQYLQLIQDANGQLNEEQRRRDATAQPENSYIWWIEARRNDKRFDEEGVRQTIKGLFSSAWLERCERYTETGSSEGVLVFGPYAPLPSGLYKAVFNVSFPGGEAGSIVRCDVVRDNEVIGSTEVRSDVLSGRLEISFRLTKPMTFGVQLRVFRSGDASLAFEYKNPKILGAEPTRLLASFGFE